MGVVNPYAGIYNGQAETNARLDRISEKLDKLIPTPNLIRRVYGKGLEIFSKTKLVWWTKVEEAARYQAKLFIVTEERNYEVGTFEIERGKLYISFPDIPEDVPCLVRLQAEGRDGKVIAEGEIKL